MTAPESVQRFTVKSADNLGNILAVASMARAICFGVATVVTPSFAGGTTNRSSTKIRSLGVIDRHERQVVVVVNLHRSAVTVCRSIRRGAS